jgi:short-subunit dehydrogenase
MKSIHSTQKNVVIKGGTRGFGRALVHQFVKRGENVIFTSRSRENTRQLLKELKYDQHDGADTIGVIGDTGSLEYLDNLRNEVLHRYAKIDVWMQQTVADSNHLQT